MPIVDLEARLTNDFDLYMRSAQRLSSFIYISAPVSLDDGPSSVELHVGDAFYSCSEDAYIQVGAEGIKLRSGESVVVDSQEKVGLPANIFGFVSGKGRYIFTGVMLSPGKIDPLFCDHLRIGLFNSGKSAAVLHRGEPLCTCAFVSMEGYSKRGMKTRPSPAPKLQTLPLSKRLMASWSREYYKLAPVIGGIVGALISAAMAYYIFKLTHTAK